MDLEYPSKTMNPPSFTAGQAAHALRVQTLFVQHQQQIHGFIQSLVPDFASADDILQECFLTVSQKALEFSLESNFPAWVRTIARYKILALHRDRCRAPLLLAEDVLEALMLAAPESDSEPSHRAQPAVEVLRLCLQKLAPAAREIIQLRYFAQHGPTEISRLRTCSVNAVNVTLARAREALRRCVEQAVQPASL
jgi:RNA polymerase sigma-70 factor (ECF subfamily)